MKRPRTRHSGSSIEVLLSQPYDLLDQEANEANWIDPTLVACGVSIETLAVRVGEEDTGVEEILDYLDFPN